MLSKQDCEELDQPLPPPSRRQASSGDEDHLNSLIAPIRAVLDSGDRVTLLKRQGDDCKLPLMPGFNDPNENIWGMGDFREHVEWARSKGIEITGYGVVMGAMSRNRWVLDFDAGDLLEQIASKVLAETGHDLMMWPRVRSGRATSPGYHLHARAAEPIKSEPLARCLDDEGHARVVCEIVGDGKQLVGPGSLHKSGRLYVTENGDINNPPTIAAKDIAAIVGVIRTFDTLPVVARPPRPVSTPRTPRSYLPGTSGREIADRYNAEHSITSALELHGYSVGNNGTHYVHPNNDSGQSVSILDDKLAYHFGANDPFGTGQTSTPFTLYAHYEHGGRWGDAVKALALTYGIAHKAEALDPHDCLWESDMLVWLMAQFEFEETPTVPNPERQPVVQPKNYVALESFDEVKARPIDWIWPGRLARGKLTLICGDPGKGKSFLSLDIASRLSKGAAFPDGYQSRPGTVLIITDEDDSADTIKPRLLAMGADVSKVKRLQTIKIDGKDSDFTLAKVSALYDVIRQCPDLQLVIIDPLMSYFGRAKSADPAEVNALLGKLNEFAADTGIGVLALVHLNKDSKSGNALYRSMGSISVVGKARLAFLVAPDKSDPEIRVVAQTKANAAAFAPALSFKLVSMTVEDGAGDIQTAKLVWQEGTIDVTADDLLGAGDQQSNGHSAEEFLKEFLTVERQSDEVTREAKERGIAFTTLKRAKEKLGVRSQKRGLRGGWVCLPLGADGSQSWEVD